MPQAKQCSQRSVGQHGPQYGQSSAPNICLTEEGVEAFLDICREKGLGEGFDGSAGAGADGCWLGGAVSCGGN